MAEARRQGLARRHAEGALPVGPPLGAEEQRRRIIRRVLAFGQIVHVGHEDDPDACLGQRPDDLTGDLGAFTLVRD
jgi:hypothetical protein